MWGFLGLLLGGGLFCVLFTLRWFRSFIILVIVVIGVAFIVIVVDYFVELLLLGRYAVERLRVVLVFFFCWRSWVLLALWFLFSLMGVLV